ncbi:hypothetical protein PCK2_000300 [Pneumocystis canis]|nr:hypothetical protein PCK2_000300 [Pneumocystis canis]
MRQKRRSEDKFDILSKPSSWGKIKTNSSFKENAASIHNTNRIAQKHKVIFHLNTKKQVSLDTIYHIYRDSIDALISEFAVNFRNIILLRCFCSCNSISECLSSTDAHNGSPSVTLAIIIINKQNIIKQRDISSFFSEENNKYLTLAKHFFIVHLITRKLSVKNNVMIKLDSSSLDKLKDPGNMDISSKIINSTMELQKDKDLDNKIKNSIIDQKRKLNTADDLENDSIMEIIQPSAGILKRRKIDLWDTEQLLEYPKNKTLSANLNIFDSYDPSNYKPKQTEYLSILPTIDKIMKTEEELEHAMTNGFFENNLFLQDFIREFQDNFNGRYDERGLKNTFESRKYRPDARIDGYKDGQYEQHFNQKQQKVSAELRAGEATTLKLPQMAEMGLFELGDIWRYSRTLGFKQRGKGRDKIEIRKDLQLTGIDESTHSLTFLCPSSTNIYFMEGDPGISIKNNSIKKSSDLKVGDLIIIQKNRRVPSDILLLHTNNPNGECFIRTDQLDGETDWKLKIATTATQPFSSDKSLFSLNATVYASPPIESIHMFFGTLSINSSSSDIRNYPLTVDNMLWANTILASGGPIIGLVIYTGIETRQAMNTSKAGTKTGLLDSEINSITKILCILTFILSFILVLLNGFEETWYISLFKFLILFSSIIPINLRINLDFGKSVYAYQIEHDSELKGIIVRTSTIPEDLGRIEYLLTDKTGTLTQNNMKIKKLHIGTLEYTSETMSEVAAYVREDYKNNRSNTQYISQRVKEIGNKIRDIVFALSVMPTIDSNTNTISYQSSSPDEMAIIQWTSSMGLTLHQRDRHTIQLYYQHTGEFIKMKILHNFPFTSKSRRMGIIIQIMGDSDKDENIWFFQKGADIVMQKIVTNNDWLDEECNNMAREGLRTLVIGRKKLSKESYNIFVKNYNQAALNLYDRDKAISEVIAESLECDLELLGLTGKAQKENLEYEEESHRQLLRRRALNVASKSNILDAAMDENAKTDTSIMDNLLEKLRVAPAESRKARRKLVAKNLQINSSHYSEIVNMSKNDSIRSSSPVDELAIKMKDVEAKYNSSISKMSIMQSSTPVMSAVSVSSGTVSNKDVAAKAQSMLEGLRCGKISRGSSILKMKNRVNDNGRNVEENIVKNTLFDTKTLVIKGTLSLADVMSNNKSSLKLNDSFLTFSNKSLQTYKMPKDSVYDDSRFRRDETHDREWRDRTGSSKIQRRRAKSSKDRSASPVRRKSLKKPKVVETIKIETNFVGLIIGRGGESLKLIEQETGARVQFYPERTSTMNQRMATISGTQTQVDTAKKRIFSAIEENKILKGLASGMKNNTDELNKSSLESRYSSIQIYIPNKAVGMVIGRGGESIRDLQERSKTYINIAHENETIHGMRPAYIFGTAESIQTAKNMIDEIIKTDSVLSFEAENPSYPVPKVPEIETQATDMPLPSIETA